MGRHGAAAYVCVLALQCKRFVRYEARLQPSRMMHMTHMIRCAVKFVLILTQPSIQHALSSDMQNIADEKQEACAANIDGSR